MSKTCSRISLIFIIITTYFALLSTQSFQDPYHYLAQGFLDGHLSLSIQTPTKLFNLANPYDPIQNAKFRNFGFHDLSLYKGQFFLYFSPLPALLFFLPFKLVTGVFPPQGLSVLFFLAIGFLVQFILLIKIKNKYFSHFSEFQLVFAGLLLGIASTAPFLLVRPMFYEAAIASTYCFMSFAVFFLYKLFENHLRLKDVFLFSLCMSLAFAGRPHFALVCLILLFAMLVYIIKHAERQRLINLLIALFLPVLCIGAALGIYNYLRFDSFFEFGLNYQLAGPSVNRPFFRVNHICLNCLHGIYNYFFHPYFTFYLYNHPKDYFIERTAGVLISTPFLFILFFLPNQIIANFTTEHPLRWFVIYTLLIPFTIILFLISISGVCHRYEMDFTPYLVFLSIISFWFLLENKHVQVWKRWFIFLGIISIISQLILSNIYGDETGKMSVKSYYALSK